MTAVGINRPVRDVEVFAAYEDGKLGVAVTTTFHDSRSLSIAHNPGVATVSKAIAREPAPTDRCTWAGRLVAVATDGAAVLGPGNAGSATAPPVMEGKAYLSRPHLTGA
jgi:malate dehydrogenase (oxaloacetate-decarboxylating)